MKEGLIKDTYELVIKEIQSFLALSYVLMVGIGMLFNYQKYTLFDINIFEYADVLDFLIAPFEDLRILFFSMFSIGAPWFFIWLDSWWHKKYPKSYQKMSFGMVQKSWYQPYRYILFGGLLIYYILLSSNIWGRKVRKEILAEPPVTIEFVDGKSLQGIMIGKTNQYLLLLSGDQKSAIPLSSAVKEIRFSK